MGTPNFMNKNASKHFVLEIEDDFEYDMQKECLQEILGEEGFNEENFTPQEDNRSYPSICIASKSIDRVIAGNDIRVTILAIVRSGYYAAINLDWDIQIETDCCSYYNENVEADQIEGDFCDLGYSEGFAKIQSKNVVNWIDKTIPTMIEELEAIYERVSEKYNCVAVFSNGEAIYEKA